ncbi:MAG: WecB/TagA/CpsF family glycosyltransferase [Pseudomonadota bacterium]
MNTVSTPVKRLDILGVHVSDYSPAEAMAFVEACIEHQRYQPIAFLNANNANIAHENPKFRDAMEHFVSFSDGIGVDIAAKMLYGAAFRANLNGTDLVPDLLRSAKKPLKVGLFGSKPGVADRAAELFAGINPIHDVRAISHGYVGTDDAERILANLEEFRPDILLIGLGVPRQEFWIVEHLNGTHCTVPMAVGALFDLTTGHVPRAPAWVRSLRSEWVYRLAVEPRRLWRRYVLGNPIFLYRVMRQKFSSGDTDVANQGSIS